MDENRRCPSCQQVKPVDAFYKNKQKASGLAVYCKDCMEQKRQQKVREYVDRNEAEGPSDLTEKRCGGCQQTLPIEQFWKDKRRKDGYRVYCKRCFIDKTAPDRARFLAKSIDKAATGVVTEKACSVCKRTLPLYEYPKSNSHAYGVNPKCRECWGKREQDRRDRLAITTRGSNWDWSQSWKMEVFKHYSSGTPHCSCCGNTYMAHLTIDHTNQDGASRRRDGEPRGGSSLWKWLKDNNYPTDFRVLCMNCNRTVYHYGSCDCKDHAHLPV